MDRQTGENCYVPDFKPKFWEETKLEEGVYDTFVETGAYRGSTIECLKYKYNTIHSIELSHKWYEFCVDRFKCDSHVHVHHGDSAHMLPKILDNIPKPVIVFLDAHYSGGSTARPSDNPDDTPLLDELRYLRGRAYDDIVIIDDTAFFGRTGGQEPAVDPLEHVMWPPFRYDWSNTTRDKVLSLMKPNYSMLVNTYSSYTVSPREDQIIWYPNRSYPGS